LETIRKPFQGVINIVRFNWHFFAIALFVMFILACIAGYFSNPLKSIIYFLCLMAFVTMCISLLASFYIYDLSDLYSLKWIDETIDNKVIVNINAGFDETSYLIQEKFKDAELIVLDFYDPIKHSEVSIKRAREAYPPFPGIRRIETTNLNLESNFVDLMFVIFSAHEIRDQKDRIRFFEELHHTLKPNGKIYVTEHLRDLPNFLVYTIGSFP